MTQEDISNIYKIIEQDTTYVHFIERIKKEFDTNTSNINSNIIVLYAVHDGQQIGFCILSYSLNKLKSWKHFLKTEGVNVDNFIIDKNKSYELIYLYIKPKYRRCGFGKTLFKKALLNIHQIGAKYLYAYTSDRGNNVIEFYINTKAKIVHKFEDEDTNIITAYLAWNV